MPLVEIQIEPGIFTEQTPRGAVRRWRDCERVRFRYGMPEKLAGWAAFADIEVEPPVRAMFDWSSLDNQQWLALGSDNNLYLVNNQALYEITPTDLPETTGDSQLRGWGSGPYGTDTDPNYVGEGWSTPRLAINLKPELPIWSLDNWGEDLMAARRGGPLYWWDRSRGANQPAQVIPNAPISNNWILVSPEDRHLVSLGSHDGVRRDQSLIRWSSQEDFNDWTPAEGNTAGDKRLDSGSRIITGIRTRGETIIFTDRSIYSMQFVGGNDVFAFQPKGESLSIVGPNAAVETGGIVYFMARDEFVAYDGVARILPCTVRNYVFDNINRDQIEKTYASVNKEESEVWWFYPSADSEENNRYVIFNLRESTWYYGNLARTAYTDSGFIDNPVAADPDGVLYEHEVGLTYGDGVLSFVESWDMEINNIGESFGHIDKFIPDFLGVAGEGSLIGSVNFTFRCRPYPRGEIITKGPYLIDADTTKVNFRARGRQIAVKIEEADPVLWAADALVPTADSVEATADGVLTYASWRMGTLRINVVPDGER